MHLDCFVAHYGVVPARRDYTYCPAHVYVPKPKPLAERRAGSGQERKLGGGGTSHERRTANGHGGHKRERVEREAERKKKRRVERDPSLGALLPRSVPPHLSSNDALQGSGRV